MVNPTTAVMAGGKRLAAPLDANGVTARACGTLEIILVEDARVRSDIETVCDDVDVNQILFGGALTIDSNAPPFLQ